jgi:hypothetical protein
MSQEAVRLRSWKVWDGGAGAAGMLQAHGKRHALSCDWVTALKATYV